MKWLYVFSAFLFSANFVVAQILDKAQDISPLLYGEVIPDLNLVDLEGREQSLSGIIGEKPTILLFYRGGWCPYCNAQLSEVQKIESEIVKLGYQIVAISPDSPEELNKSIEKNELKYHLYSDADGTLTKAIGIAFKAPERNADMLFKNSGGLNDGFLPVPSVFVVDKDRTILFEYINPDYKTRLTSKMLLTVLRPLKE
jgi:peroxiredoxin